MILILLILAVIFWLAAGIPGFLCMFCFGLLVGAGPLAARLRGPTQG